MSLWKIAWRSIQQRALASALTAVSMALGVSLVVAVLVIHSVVDQSFHRGGEGYDLIVGAARGAGWNWCSTAVYYIGPARRPHSYSTTRTHRRPHRLTARRDGHSDLPGRQLRGLSRGGHHARHVRRASTTWAAQSTSLPRAELQARELSRGGHRRHRGAQDRPEGRRARSGPRTTSAAQSSTSTAVQGGRRPGADRHAQRPGLFVNIEGFYRQAGPIMPKRTCRRRPRRRRP